MDCRRWIYAWLWLSCLGLSGCSVLSLSAIGSVASLGDSGVTYGRDHYYFGKLKTAEMARFDVARHAVRQAADDLGLKSKWPDRIKGSICEMAFVDDDGSQVGVQIDRRSTSMVRLRVDVGLFGSEVVARLFLIRIRSHLPSEQPATQPVIGYNVGPT